MNLGFKIWKQHMEKDFQKTFLYQMKYDKNLNSLSYQMLMGFILTLVLLITLLLQLIVEKSYIIGLILYLILYIGGFFYILDNDKNSEYQEQFVKDKKYSYPILLMIIWIVMAIMIFVVYSYTASGSK
jgi:predicted membrane protein